MGRITSSRTQLKPDPRYKSVLVSKFVNSLMWDGKKTVAQKVVYDAMDELAKRVKDGIRAAGGLPFEFPVHPIGEQGKRPDG